MEILINIRMLMFLVLKLDLEQGLGQDLVQDLELGLKQVIVMNYHSLVVKIELLFLLSF